jgi:hypothetical protein
MKTSYRFLSVLAIVLLWVIGGVFGVTDHSRVAQAGPLPAPDPRIGSSSCGTVSCTTYLPLVLNSYPLRTEVEVTQGAQLPDNSVMLIAGRETMVRLTLTDEREPMNVSAWLQARRGDEVLGSVAAWNNPRHLSSTAQRSLLGDTFNFILPDSWTSGDVSFWATASNGSDYAVETAPTAPFHFASANPLHVTVVPVRYTCTGGGTITPPAPYDYLVENFTYKVYPVPYVDLAVHGAYNYTGPCNSGQPAPTSQDWFNILNGVTNMWIAEGRPNSYYYGLIHDIYCGGGCIAGIGWVGYDKAAVGFNGFGASHSGASETHAHEVGHNYGRSHAPGCGAGNTDPDYPYTDAYIGDAASPVYGFDFETYALRPYYSSYDFMSYCGAEWTSDYTYEALYAYDNLAMDRASETVSGPTMMVSGEIDATTGRATLGPAYTLEGPAQIPTPGDYTLELRDERGRLLTSHSFTPGTADIDRYPHGTSTQVRGFHLRLPAVEGVASARVLHDGEILGRLEARPGAPRLGAGISARHVTGEGARVSWAAGEPEGEGLHYMVRVSTDGGESWQVVAVDHTTPAITLRPEDFGGQEVLVEVLASDGLHTTPLRLGPIAVPAR